jgi:hypothetical protein
MNADPQRQWRRWLEADLDRDDDADADAALRGVFDLVPPDLPSLGFTDRVMNAVAVAAEQRARRAKAVGALATAAAVAAIVASVLLLVEYGPRLLIRGIDLSVQAMLWALSATERGMDVWTIVSQIGRAAAAVIVAPQVSTAMIAMALIAMTALYGLHRVLGLDQESYR